MPKDLPKLPEGLENLLRGLSKAVLKEKPENILVFSANYFETLLIERDGSLMKNYERFEHYENSLHKISKQKKINSDSAKKIVKSVNKNKKTIGDSKVVKETAQNAQPHNKISKKNQKVPSPIFGDKVVEKEAPRKIMETTLPHGKLKIRTRSSISLNAITEESSSEIKEERRLMYRNAVKKIQRAFREYIKAKKLINPTMESYDSSKSRKMNEDEAARIIQKVFKSKFHKKMPPQDPHRSIVNKNLERVAEVGEDSKSLLEYLREEENCKIRNVELDSDTGETLTTNVNEMKIPNADSLENMIINEDLNLTGKLSAGNDKVQELAAIKIQSTFRGHQVRKEMKEQSAKQENVTKNVPDPAVDDIMVYKNNGEMEAAAIKIQKNYRGYKVRKNMHSTKNLANSTKLTAGNIIGSVVNPLNNEDLCSNANNEIAQIAELSRDKDSTNIDSIEITTNEAILSELNEIHGTVTENPEFLNNGNNSKDKLDLAGLCNAEVHDKNLKEISTDIHSVIGLNDPESTNPNSEIIESSPAQEVSQNTTQDRGSMIGNKEHEQDIESSKMHPSGNLENESQSVAEVDINKIADETINSVIVPESFDINDLNQETELNKTALINNSKIPKDIIISETLVGNTEITKNEPKQEPESNIIASLVNERTESNPEQNTNHNGEEVESLDVTIKPIQDIDSLDMTDLQGNPVSNAPHNLEINDDASVEIQNIHDVQRPATVDSKRETEQNMIPGIPVNNEVCSNNQIAIQTPEKVLYNTNQDSVNIHDSCDSLPDLNDPEMADAAIKIQKSFRGLQDRKKSNLKQPIRIIPEVTVDGASEEMLSEPEVFDNQLTTETVLSLPENKETFNDLNSSQMNEAAVKIQKSVREYLRKKKENPEIISMSTIEIINPAVDIKSTETPMTPQSETNESDARPSDNKQKHSDQQYNDFPDQYNAALKIQKNFRGYQVRKELKQKKPETAESSNNADNLNSTCVIESNGLTQIDHAMDLRNLANNQKSNLHKHNSLSELNNSQLAESYVKSEKDLMDTLINQEELNNPNQEITYELNNQISAKSEDDINGSTPIEISHKRSNRIDVKLDNSKEDEITIEKTSVPDVINSDKITAAIKIQKSYRGYKVRQDYTQRHEGVLHNNDSDLDNGMIKTTNKEPSTEEYSNLANNIILEPNNITSIADNTSPQHQTILPSSNEVIDNNIVPLRENNSHHLNDSKTTGEVVITQKLFTEQFDKLIESLPASNENLNALKAANTTQNDEPTPLNYLSNLNTTENERKSQRNLLEHEDSLPNLDDPEMTDAALKIQKSFRGHQARKESKQQNIDQSNVTVKQNSELMSNLVNGIIDVPILLESNENLDSLNADNTTQNDESIPLISNLNVTRNETKSQDIPLEHKDSLPNLDDPAMADAALKIQKSFRGYQARKESKQQKIDQANVTVEQTSELISNLDNSIIDISTNSSFTTKDNEMKSKGKPLEQEDSLPDLTDPEMTDVALKIQKSFRDHQVRKESQQQNINGFNAQVEPTSTVTVNLENDTIDIEISPDPEKRLEHEGSLPDLNDPEMAEAALKIQKSFRGLLARKGAEQQNNEQANAVVDQTTELICNVDNRIIDISTDSSCIRNDEIKSSDIPLENEDSLTNLIDPAMSDAALKIQKSFRRHQSRKKSKQHNVGETIAPVESTTELIDNLGNDITEIVTDNIISQENEIKSPDTHLEHENSLPNLGDLEMTNAALKIQKSFRDHQTRKSSKQQNNNQPNIPIEQTSKIINHFEDDSIDSLTQDLNIQNPTKLSELNDSVMIKIQNVESVAKNQTETLPDSNAMKSLSNETPTEIFDVAQNVAQQPTTPVKNRMLLDQLQNENKVDVLHDDDGMGAEPNLEAITLERCKPETCQADPEATSNVKILPIAPNDNLNYNVESLSNTSNFKLIPNPLENTAVAIIQEEKKLYISETEHQFNLPPLNSQPNENDNEATITAQTDIVPKIKKVDQASLLLTNVEVISGNEEQNGAISANLVNNKEATTVSANQNDIKIVRPLMENQDNLPDLNDPEIIDAALKIQKSFRGYKTQNELKSNDENASIGKILLGATAPNLDEITTNVYPPQMAEPLTDIKVENLSELQNPSSNAESNILNNITPDILTKATETAAINIQRVYRGYRTRRDLKHSYANVLTTDVEDEIKLVDSLEPILDQKSEDKIETDSLDNFNVEEKPEVFEEPCQKIVYKSKLSMLLENSKSHTHSSSSDKAELKPNDDYFDSLENTQTSEMDESAQTVIELQPASSIHDISSQGQNTYDSSIFGLKIEAEHDPQDIQYDSMSRKTTAEIDVADSNVEARSGMTEDEIKEIQNIDLASFEKDSLEAMYYSLRKNELLLDQMHNLSNVENISDQTEPPRQFTAKQKLMSMGESDSDDIVFKQLSVDYDEYSEVSNQHTARSTTDDDADVEVVRDVLYYNDGKQVLPNQNDVKREPGDGASVASDNLFDNQSNADDHDLLTKSATNHFEIFSLDEEIKNLESNVTPYQQDNPHFYAQQKIEKFLHQIHGKMSETEDDADDENDDDNIETPIDSNKSYLSENAYEEEDDIVDELRNNFAEQSARKVLSSAVSEADSDYIEQSKRIPIKDDFNISTVLDYYLSTDSDSTYNSAATKIQAGARGFLTRRRIQSINRQSISERRSSIGNAAIDQSLDDMIEENEESKKFKFHQTQSTFREDTITSSGEMEMYGITDIKVEEKKITSPITDSGNESTTSIDTETQSHLRNKYERFENESTFDAIQEDNLSDVVDVIRTSNIQNKLRSPIKNKTLSNINFDEYDRVATRRMTLQRGNAVQGNSTPSDEDSRSHPSDSSSGTTNDSEEKNDQDSANKTSFDSPIRRKSIDSVSLMTKSSNSLPDLENTSKKHKKGFIQRQRTMPVQIETEIIRPLPKHMRKRNKSANSSALSSHQASNLYKKKATY